MTIIQIRIFCRGGGSEMEQGMGTWQGEVWQGIQSSNSHK